MKKRSPNYFKFIRALRKLRIKKRLTQKNVAGILQKNPSYVSKIELGRYIPDPIEFIDLMRVMKATETEIENLIGIMMKDTRKRRNW